jgi:hypothetical protein
MQRLVVAAFGMGAKRLVLLENELHAYPHELDELGVGVFVGFFGVGADTRMRDLGEIAHDLADVSGKAACVVDAGRTEAIQKPLAPLGERRSTRIERVFVTRQQRLELHLLAGQGFTRRSVKFL